MSTPNYSLEIISHHPQFNNKSLRQYHVDGINTVGAWGDEPFEICFRNNTYSKIQVKLSLDGTDVFNGKVADTSVADKMWVVNGNSTLSLKAWAENNHGGASFVFTNASNGVAANTHGNLSSRGIIAAAVFTEGYVAPVFHTYCYTCGYSHYLGACPRLTVSGGTFGGTTITSGGTWSGDLYSSNGTFHNTTVSSGSIYNCNSLDSRGEVNTSASMDNMEMYDAEPASSAPRERRSKSLQSSASVGAGQHVNQNITYVSGLIKPSFAETVRVRYLWWDELVAALRTHHVPASHASGFPGDDTRGHINLSGVPRVGEKHGCFRRAEETYSRV